jgi:hypothetical protein
MRTFIATLAATLAAAGFAAGGEEAVVNPADELHADQVAQPKVSLEGDWQPYQTTSLSVRRTINIERDGQSHQAEVTAPVLVRRGAVFLDPDRIAEILSIRKEIDALKTDILRVSEKSKELGERYARLIEAAASQVPDRGEPDPAGIGGVAMRSNPNEDQSR